MPFAEDVVQESLLRLWRKPEIMEQPTRVCAQVAVHRRPQSGHRRPAQCALHPRAADRQPPRTPSLDAIGPAVDKWVLSDALKSLSPDHRTVIVRAYYLGQTVADIAQQEQIPEGTVKSRLHYAMRALRIALQERGVVR